MRRQLPTDLTVDQADNHLGFNPGTTRHVNGAPACQTLTDHQRKGVVSEFRDPRGILAVAA